MNKSQENKFTMLRTIDEYLDSKSSIISGIDELTTNHQLLKSKTTEIKAKDDEKINATKGKVSTKHYTKAGVVSMAIAIAGGVYAYGKKIKNNEILERADITKSDLRKMRDSELVEAVESLRDLATLHSSLLEPFGISQTKLEAFSGKITQFDNAFVQKENSVITQTGATKSLVTLFREADEILNSIDKLVNGLNDDQKEFVRDYYAGRTIKRLGIRYEKDKGASPPVIAVNL